MALQIRSPAFEDGQPIPRCYSCEGADVSPPLRWQGAPTGCRSLVLIVDDPDAPDPRAPQTTWVHWVVYNLPVGDGGLDEDAAEHLPEGALHGLNDWHRAGYGGPCPPIGEHRYFHRIHALDTTLAFPAPPTRDEVDAAMSGHVLAEAVLMGTYRRAPADDR